MSNGRLLACFPVSDGSHIELAIIRECNQLTDSLQFSHKSGKLKGLVIWRILDTRTLALGFRLYTA
jgi:hypothetical protein